jgi:tRNA A-37 threonylcarbamoyl transferase component Bud32
MAGKRNYQDENGDWVKEFAVYDILVPLYVRGHLKSAFPDDKIEAEEEADSDLSKLYITHPEVKEVSKSVSEEEGIISMYSSLISSDSGYPSIKTEGIDSKNLREQVRDLDITEKREAADTIGRILGDLHLRGNSHGDPKLDNFLYTEEDGTIPFDFEGYNSEATMEHLREDISIFDANIRTLRPETYENMREAFKAGYLEEVSHESEPLPDQDTFIDLGLQNKWGDMDDEEWKKFQNEYTSSQDNISTFDDHYEYGNMNEDEWESLFGQETDDVDVVKAGRGLWFYSMLEKADGYSRREHVNSFLKNAQPTFEKLVANVYEQFYTNEKNLY